MSTLNVANISDDQSTLTGSNTNLDDRLHFNKTVDTKFVTNGCAKSWVNFDGTGTVAIRESTNVASLVDEGSGRHRINLTSSMSSSNEYAITATKQDVSVNTDCTVFDASNSRSASAYVILSIEEGGKRDSNNTNVIQMGDLA